MLAVTWPGDFVINIDMTDISKENLKSATGTINVVTNNPTGYTLTAEIDGTTNDLTNTYDTNYTIPNLTSTTTAANFPVNHWGYAIGNLDNFSPFPSTVGDTIELNITTGPAASSTTDFSIATKINAETASGTYTNKVKFTAVTNYIPPEVITFDKAYAQAGKTKDETTGFYKMQDMDSSICSAVTEPDPDNVQDAQMSVLVDTRDGKTYGVAKLADGKCWMTQNLDFDITDEKLTSENTNLVDTTEWTPDHTTIPKDQVSTWDNANTSLRSYDPGGEDGEYIFTSGSTSNDTIYTSLDACTEAGHTASECMHYSSGNLYNWTAAKATNNSTSQTAYASSSNDSICPKGWTLPSANSQAPSEFGTMLYDQGIITSATASGSSAYTSDGLNKVRTAPLYWVRAGSVTSGSRGTAGLYGYYWSSTAYNSSNAYFPAFGSFYISPRGSDYRYLGLSVRCIAL